ncbi:MAG: sensor histidine kinase [Oscillospiraceae bacterium]
MIDTLQKLCERHTTLNDEDIKKLSLLLPSLQIIANIENGDVFIDCPTKDKQLAIVVAHANPSYAKSSYKKNVVGLMAKKEDEPAVIRSIELNLSTKEFEAITQENVKVTQTVEPILNNNKVIGAIVIEKHSKDNSVEIYHNVFNNENDENIEKAIYKLFVDYKVFDKFIDLPFLAINYNGVVCFRNNLAKDFYSKIGYVRDILGMKYDNINLDYKDIKPEEKGEWIEVVIGKYDVQLKKMFINDYGINFFIIIKDVSYLRQKEKEIFLKDIELKEMNHRIKNNLQTIASILRLQLRRVESEKCKNIIIQTINRVISIAFVHDMLSLSTNSKISLFSVIKDIFKIVKKDFCKISSIVKLEIIGDDIMLNVDTGSSISLVCNEIIQNCLKHAFLNKDEGNIKITIRKGERYSCIDIVDDGNGFLLKDLNKKNLGMNIVKAIVEEKLNGKIDIDSGFKGTKFSFDFKNIL